MRNYGSHLGFALTELMFAVAIVAILAGIALPTYQSTVLKGNRPMATRTLIDFAAKQESERIKRRKYLSSFKDLIGIDATTVFVSRTGKVTSSVEADTVYSIEMSGVNAAATQFTLRASAQQKQVRDSQCASFTLTSNGVKTATGSASDPLKTCWNL